MFVEFSGQIRILTTIIASISVITLSAWTENGGPSHVLLLLVLLSSVGSFSWRRHLNTKSKTPPNRSRHSYSEKVDQIVFCVLDLSCGKVLFSGSDNAKLPNQRSVTSSFCAGEEEVRGWC